MGAIVAYAGAGDAPEHLLGALGRVSRSRRRHAALVVQNSRGLRTCRAAGTATALADEVHRRAVHGRSGVGYVRTAVNGVDRGGPESLGRDCTGTIALASSGSLVNEPALREAFEPGDHDLRRTERDGILAHLIEDACAGALEDRVAQVLPQLQGTIALLVMTSLVPDHIVVASRGVPLVFAAVDGASWVVSHPALLPRGAHCARILGDGEIGVVTAAGYRRAGVAVMDPRRSKRVSADRGPARESEPRRAM